VPDRDLHTVTVGTRESKLALLQTELVVGRLHERFPDIAFLIKPVTTHGDKVLSKPIAEVGSRGVFVKELEEALLAHEVDLVVHSLKDLPTELPAGLTLAAVLDRQDPRDVLVSRNRVPFRLLPGGSKVATSSRRRAAQLKAARQDVEFIDIRGNIPTRLRKLDEGVCDAMVLAAAGLLRLGETGRIAEYLDVEFSTPAAGQGALAVECRQDDDKILHLAATIEDKPARAEVTAERVFLEKLGGGCSVPIGAVCLTLSDGRLHLTGCVASLDGSTIMRRSLDGQPDRAADLGARLADLFFEMGAGPVLSRLKESAPATVSPP
jgi:hydroxymethylbilane synthase